MGMDYSYPKIMSEQFKHDMGPWLTEKSESCLKTLDFLRKDLLTVEKNIDKEILKYIHQDILMALSYITKIYSFSVGSEWNDNDVDLVFDNPDDGLEKLQVKYGLLDKTSKQKENEKKEAFVNKIKEYVSLEQYPGRTLLQQLFENHLFYLNPETSEGRLFKHVDDELEKMANGETPWLEFSAYVKKILSIK